MTVVYFTPKKTVPKTDRFFTTRFPRNVKNGFLLYYSFSRRYTDLKIITELVISKAQLESLCVGIIFA